MQNNKVIAGRGGGGGVCGSLGTRPSIRKRGSGTFICVLHGWPTVPVM